MHLGTILDVMCCTRRCVADELRLKQPVQLHRLAKNCTFA